MLRLETEADRDVERPLQPGRPLQLPGGRDGLQRGQVGRKQTNKQTNKQMVFNEGRSVENKEILTIYV